jgi:predicted glycosyltransferase
MIGTVGSSDRIRMTVWIDLSNSPHVAFMRPFIRRFERDGVSYVITARDYGNTIDLLNVEGWTFHVVGGHGGKSIFGKLLAFPQRVWLLLGFLRKRQSTVAFSQSSFYSPLVARMLGIPFVYTNDNEYAKGNLFGRIPGGATAYPAAMRSAPQARTFFSSNTFFYEGVKEGIYLSQTDHAVRQARDSRVFFYRPEPWQAQYHDAAPEFSLEIVRAMQALGEVQLVCRDQRQREYYRAQFADAANVTVIETVVTLDDIVRQASAFVGSGGTMCRELALLGVPTVSLYTGELLAVDRALIDAGLMLHTRDPIEMKSFLENSESRAAHGFKADEMLKLGAVSFEQICSKVYALAGR